MKTIKYLVTFKLTVNQPEDISDEIWKPWNEVAAAGYVAEVLGEHLSKEDSAEDVRAYELASGCGSASRGSSTVSSEPEKNYPDLHFLEEAPLANISGASVASVTSVTVDNNKQLYEKLKDAALIWENKSYVQNSAWTSTNEDRRARNLKTIKSLIEWYEEKGFYTQKQVSLGERMVTNAKAAE